MGRASPEEQLLFGVLAVQLGFVRPDDVIAAAAAWLADRSQNLAERLEASDAIDARQRELIMSFMVEAIRIHDGDARRALDTMGGTRVVASTFGGSVVLGPDGVVPAVAPDRDAQHLGDTLILAPGGPERYELRGEYDRGGQARVLVAFDQNVGREVAWKELHPGRDSDTPLGRTSTLAVRFLREARITGQLEHPNIVPVYDVGIGPDQQPYYTMRLVRGETLDQRLAACSGLDERMGLLGSVLDICQAIAFAHSRGVIHRDIKPANVMVGEFGETVVLDWGLAKARGVEDERGTDLQRQVRRLQVRSGDRTIEGAAMGTPSYMSPEQAEGQIDEIDERSDIWGLGAVLYELLTGRPPFVGETPFEILGKVMGGKIPPVAELCPQAPVELVAVAEKALRREKRDRYESAQDLAREISAYMTGRRVAAYDYSSWDLLKRFARRNKVLVAASAVLLLVILGALAMVLLALRDERAALTREQIALGGVQTERLHAAHNLATAHFRQAQWLARERRFLAARIFAAASLAANPAQPGSRHYDAAFAAANPSARWLAVEAASLGEWAQADLELEFVTRFTAADELHTVAFLPGASDLAATDRSGALQVLSVSTGQELMRVAAHPEGGVPLLALPDGHEVLTGGSDGTIKRWRVGLATPIQVWTLPTAVVSLAATRDGAWIAAGGSDARVYLVDRRSGASRALPPIHTAEVHCLAFSPDDRWLATASWDGSAKLVDWRTGRTVEVLRANDDSLASIVFSPAGDQALTGGYDGRVRVWEVASGRLVHEMVADTNTARALAFAPSGAFVASAGTDDVMRLWDAKTGRLLVAVDGPRKDVYTLSVASDGSLLASGSYDKSVNVWRIIRNPHRRRVKADSWIYGLAVARTGQKVVFGTWNQEVRVLDARSLEPTARCRIDEPVYSVAVDPRGERIAIGTRGGGVFLWAPVSGRAPERIGAHAGDVLDMAFSPDGTRLLTTATDGRLRSWDAATGQALHSATGFGDRAWAVDVSPDGDSVAAIGDNGAILVFDSDGLRLRGTIQTGHRGGTDVRWSADGRRLFSACGGAEVLVFDVAEARLVQRLAGHKRWIHVLGLTPDGRLLASAGLGGEVVIWDATSGDPLQIIHVGGAIENLAFQPAGDSLWVVSKDGLQAYPVRAPTRDVDVQALLYDTQRRAGLRLDQFDLPEATEPDGEAH